MPLNPNSLIYSYGAHNFAFNVTVQIQTYHFFRKTIWSHQSVLKLHRYQPKLRGWYMR